MEAQEIDATLDELENRLDRLRSLYEQYFLGIEKIEPQVARKDVDRRFWMLRKTVIRNTARRFRFQVLIQRYNTFQQHWTRICREIENGTYVRHLLKVKKNFGEPKTWAARKRLGLLRKGIPGEPAEGAGAGDEAGADAATGETSSDLSGMLTGGDRDAEVLAATAAAFEQVDRPKPVRPGALQTRFSLDDLGPLNLDFDDDPEPTLPPKPAPAAPVLPKPAAASPPTTRVASSVKIPTFPPPVPIGDSPRPQGLPQKPPLPRTGAAGATGARPPLPARPPIPGAPRLPTGLGAPPAPAPRKEPAAEPFPPAPSSPSSAPPPRPRLPAQSGGRPPLPGIPVPSNGANGARPAARPPLPEAPAAARPGAAPTAPRAVPPNAAAPAGTGVVALPRPAAVTGGPARPPEPRPNPAAASPRQPPPAAARDLSDDRLKQLHRELIETKKKLNLESNLSLDALSRSLRDTERKLRAEHQGRSVDFQVVVKDGKAVVKPIVRK